MKKGCLFWITGLSGSGKSTVGKIFYSEYKKKFPNTVFLDGDEIRAVFNNFDYSSEGRSYNFYQVIELCKLLVNQNLNVIACASGMKNELKDYCRLNFDRYEEVYLRVSIEELIRRDSKGLYQKALDGKEKNVQGINLDYDEPINSDVVIDNEGEIKAYDAAQYLIDRYLNIE